MGNISYVPFYTSDFLSGVGGMTAATRGVYITLLCLMYEHEKPIETPWPSLARRCGCSQSAFKKAIADLLDEDKITVEEGRIWSPTCDKHIVLRREKSLLAKSSAEKRWKKSEEKQGGGDAKADPPDSERDANQIQIQIQKEKEEKEKRERDFEAFWLVVPRRVGKGAARKAFAKALKTVEAEVLISAMKMYASHVDGREWQFKVHPATWLNQERWLDEYNTAKGPNATYEQKMEAAAGLIKTGKRYLCGSITSTMAQALIQQGYITEQQAKDVGVI